MKVLYYPPQQDFIQKTLGAQLLAGTTAAATLNNVTSIQNKPGVMIVDRIDTNGVETPTKREVIIYQATSGSTVTTLTRNADGGGTDQDHAVGAIVEFGPDILWAQSVIDGLSQVLDPSTGALDTTKVVNLSTAQTLTNKILPKIQGAGSAAQYVQAVGEYDNGNSGTGIAIDWSKGDRQLVTMTGNCTFTFSNAVKGQTLTVRVVEDGTGGRTLTWPTLKWPGGTVGAATTTAGAINLYIFYFDGTNYLAQLAAGFA